MIVAGHRLGWLLLTVDALTVARLTRLITTDSLLTRPRQTILARWPPRPGRLSELAVCPWCVSVWAAAGVLTVSLLIPGWWLPAAVVLSLSEVAGIIAEHT